MKPVFIQPKFSGKENPAGVYKITFDGTYFYIGGSIGLRSRFSQWKTRLNQGTNKNHKIRELFKTTSEIVFEIIELTGTDNPKVREDFYIKENWGNPLFLNSCPSAYDNTGLKHTVTQQRKFQWKKVAMFDMEWNFIKEFDKIADCSNELNIRSGDISAFMKGKCQFIKGYKFKFISSDGSYIEPLPFISKRPPLKPKKIRQHPTPAKKILQFDLGGNLVKVHESMGSAAKSINTDKSNLKYQVRRSATGFCKGYIWKYA